MPDTSHADLHELPDYPADALDVQAAASFLSQKAEAYRWVGKFEDTPLLAGSDGSERVVVGLRGRKSGAGKNPTLALFDADTLAVVGKMPHLDDEAYAHLKFVPVERRRELLGVRKTRDAIQDLVAPTAHPDEGMRAEMEAGLHALQEQLRAAREEYAHLQENCVTATERLRVLNADIAAAKSEIEALTTRLSEMLSAARDELSIWESRIAHARDVAQPSAAPQSSESHTALVEGKSEVNEAAIAWAEGFAEKVNTLTPREREVFDHIEKSNKAIARIFDIAEGTVKLYVTAILRKLGMARNEIVAASVIAKLCQGEMASVDGEYADEMRDFHAAVSQLTPRQREIMGCIWRPLKDIARRFGLAEGTVKLHVTAILAALGLSKREIVAQLASYIFHHQRNPEALAALVSGSRDVLALTFEDHTARDGGTTKGTTCNSHAAETPLLTATEPAKAVAPVGPVPAEVATETPIAENVLASPLKAVDIIPPGCFSFAEAKASIEARLAQAATLKGAFVLPILQIAGEDLIIGIRNSNNSSAQMVLLSERGKHITQALSGAQFAAEFDNAVFRELTLDDLHESRQGTFRAFKDIVTLTETPPTKNVDAPEPSAPITQPKPAAPEPIVKTVATVAEKNAQRETLPHDTLTTELSTYLAALQHTPGNHIIPLFRTDAAGISDIGLQKRGKTVEVVLLRKKDGEIATTSTLVGATNIAKQHAFYVIASADLHGAQRASFVEIQHSKQQLSVEPRPATVEGVTAPLLPRTPIEGEALKDVISQCAAFARQFPYEANVPLLRTTTKDSAPDIGISKQKGRVTLVAFNRTTGEMLPMNPEQVERLMLSMSFQGLSKDDVHARHRHHAELWYA